MDVIVTKSAGPKLQKSTPRIGGMLRERRRRLKMTLDAVSEATGLTKGFLSDIERDKTSPSVASLVRLCDVLMMPVGDLFPSSTSAIVRANERTPIEFGGTGASDHLLTPGNNPKLQVIWSEIEPAGTGGDQLYALSSEEEFVLVISGALDLALENDTIRLNEGDAITFDPRRPHSFSNPSATTKAVAMFILTPPPN